MIGGNNPVHQETMSQKGRLFIVSTPIGNLQDITRRALQVLSEVEAIACEDTRQTVKLLNAFGLKKDSFLTSNRGKAEDSPDYIHP